MNSHLKTFIVLLIICSFVFMGCSNNGINVSSAEETAVLIETTDAPEAVKPTATTEPTATITPTAVQDIIPCTITFDTNRDGNLEIYSIAPDGSDTVNLTNNPADDWCPSWSPDGSQIVFTSNRVYEDEGGQFIYIMDADGGNVRRLSPDNGSDWADWSHDGSQIAYSFKDDIYIINADGSGESLNLTNSPEKESQPAWSPDGSQIAFLIGEEGHQDIAVMNADGSNVLQISDDGLVFSIAWTVDGRIFADWDNQDFGCHNCVINADGTNIINAGGKGEIQQYLPFWTLDGERAEVVEADALTGDSEILMILQNDPENILNLTQNPAADRYPDWPANCGPAGNDGD